VAFLTWLGHRLLGYIHIPKSPDRVEISLGLPDLICVIHGHGSNYFGLIEFLNVKVPFFIRCFKSLCVHFQVLDSFFCAVFLLSICFLFLFFNGATFAIAWGVM
jgi:hypothetical protein